jgi:inosine-uridine nucleoside N-ribohydrolase
MDVDTGTDGAVAIMPAALHRDLDLVAVTTGPVPDDAPVHDALCIAALVDRSVIETRRVNVVEETTGDYTVVCTVVDHGKLTGREPNCDVAFNADGKKSFEIMQSTFA